MLKTSGFPDAPHIQHLPDLDLETRRRLHGRGSVSPLTPVTAGAATSVTFRFDLGQMPVPAGGHLRIGWLWPFDWGELQTQGPDDDGYLSALSSREGVELRPTYAFRGDMIPWVHHLDIEVVAGELPPGADVQVSCRRWRAPTFVVPEAGFIYLLSDPDGDGWLEVPAEPGFAVVVGPPAALFALAPSDARPGEEVELTLRVEDEWGNALRLTEVAPRVAPSDAAAPGAVEAVGDLPVYRCPVRFASAGTHRVSATVPGTALEATTNPVRVTDAAPALRVFWGDLHAGQGFVGCGVGSIPHHFDYVRHVAGLQVSSHQANDHHVTLDLWERTRRESEAAHDEGRFVAFLGCEWSAFTEDGGDRNVFYRRDEPRLRRSDRFFTEDVADPEPDLKSATAFLEAMRDEEVYINMHAGGRPTNLEYHEPVIESLAEIHSTHGTSDWFVLDALRRGYRVGVTAGTDGVAGRPGCDHPGSRMIRNVRSGVTAFLAPELTHDSLWEAIGARRCYATDGERMLLQVTVDGAPMGGELSTDGEPQVEIAVEGTAAIESVELLCGAEVVWTWRLAPPGDDGNLRILWGGTQARGSAPDQRALWEGGLTVTEGRIRAWEPVALVTPWDRLQQVDEGTLRFATVTAGNRMGLHLDLEGDASTVCRFDSGPATFEFGLAQVSAARMVVDAGGVSRRVVVERSPDEAASRRAELTWRDTRSVRGCCPYWVRVTQVDQHCAWSSPVYVERTA